MEEIIKPVSKELLKAELTEDRRLRIRVIIRFILLLIRMLLM